MSDRLVALLLAGQDFPVVVTNSTRGLVRRGPIRRLDVRILSALPPSQTASTPNSAMQPNCPDAAAPTFVRLRSSALPKTTQ